VQGREPILLPANNVTVVKTVAGRKTKCTNTAIQSISNNQNISTNVLVMDTITRNIDGTFLNQVIDNSDKPIWLPAGARIRLMSEVETVIF